MAEALEATQGPTLLVAHSYAGVPAALAVARLPQKLLETVSTILLGATCRSQVGPSSTTSAAARRT